MDTAAETELECRVCRSGAEERRPLFHPCKCSGSIKFIHQDCLLEWIKFSNQSQPRCELCGEEFSFTPVYREGAPQQLPMEEFVYAVIPHAGGVIRRVLRISLLVFLWIGVLPVFTSYVIDICNVFVFQETLRFEFSASELWHAFWNGLLECILLLGLSTAVTHVWEGILRDARANHNQPQHGDQIARALELFGREWLHLDLAALDWNIVDDPNPAAAFQQQTGDGTLPITTEGDERGDNSSEGQLDHLDPTLDAHDPPPVLPGGADGEHPPEVPEQHANDHHADPPQVPAYLPTQLQQPEPAPAPAPVNEAHGVDILPWEDDPHEPDAPWVDEMLDLDRPVTRAIVRWLRICLYNVTFILAFEVVPVQVGRTVLANTGITLADVVVPVHTGDQHLANTTLQSNSTLDDDTKIGTARTEELNMVLVHEYVTRRAFALICGAIGYGSIALTLLAMYCTYITIQCTLNEQYRRRHIRGALSIVSSVFKWYKVATMVLIKGIIIPAFVGVVLNIVTLKTCNTTLDERLYHCQQVPLICGLMHWVVGLFFVLHVTSCTTELRKILRSDILAGILPVEADPGANLIETLASRPFMLFIQQSCFGLCFYMLSVLLCIFLPVRIGHMFIPFAAPLQLRFEGLFLEVQLPFELLLSHVVVPVALERVNYRAMIATVERTFMSFSSKMLGLEDVLETDDEQDEVEIRAPPTEPHESTAMAQTNQESNHTTSSMPWWYFPRRLSIRYMGYSVRYLVLVIWTIFATVVAFSWVIRLPLAIGRTVLSLLHLPAGHDFYNASVGLALLGAAKIGLQYFWHECLAQSDVFAGFRTGLKWVWVLAKVLTLAVLWLTIIPLMLGVIFELVLVIPLRVPVDEMPKIPIPQCWALGLVSLKVWVRLVMLGVFGDTLWKRRFDRVKQNGVVNVRFRETLMEVFVPMFMGIGDYLFIPYLLGKLVATSNYSSIPLALRLFRYSFTCYLGMRVASQLFELMIGQFKQIHDQIRDNRYLLGLELSNRPLEEVPSEVVH